MKIKKVTANNRKKSFEILSSAGKNYEYPYSRLQLKPTAADPIQEVYSDPELAYQGFTYRLASGSEDSLVFDQVLEYVKDPEYLRKALLFKLSMQAQIRIKELKVPKREIIRRMDIAPSQFYRLLDQTNTHKTIDQMIKLMSALDCSVDIQIKKSA